MTTRVYDKNGQERDIAWLRSEYGNIQIERATGQRFELTEIRETDGPTVLMVGLIGETGAPHPGQPVGHWWPNANAAMTSDLTPGNFKTLPYTRAAYERTDGSGWTGFGLGGGSYYDPAASSGPDTIWVLSPSLPSDIVRGLGWKAGTNHRGPMRLTFRITSAPEPEPVLPPELDSDLGYLVMLAAGMPATWTAEKTATQAAARLAALREVA